MVIKNLSKRNYTIYAIYDPVQKLAFIGKSYAQTLGPLYSKHLCSRNIYTKNYFGKTPPLVVPRLSILEHVFGTYRDAYRHIVAWVRVFADNNYMMLMQNTTIGYADSMQPPTEAIYESISTTPLDDVLNVGLCTKFRPSVKPSAEKSDTERGCNSVQFNLRIFEKDMLDFVRFCETHGFSRKEGFALLMNCCPGINGNDRSPEEEIIKLLKSKLDDHKAQLELTQDKLTKLNTDIRSDTRYRSLLDSMQALLQKYCRLILPEDAQPDEELRICKYHDIPDVDKYEYPSEDKGIMTITLDGLAYGRGRSPAIFIFAKTEDGSLVKFRYYSKKDYIGISIPHSDWAFPEAKWLITWQKAKDGAIDLKGSIPIPLNLTDTAADDHTDDLDDYPDLLFSEDILYELYEPEPIADPELLYPVISHDTVSFEDILIDPEPCDIPKSAAKKSTTVIADDFQNNEDPPIEKGSLDALIRHAQAKHRK